MNLELSARRNIYRIQPRDMNEIQTPFTRSLSEESDTSATGIPFIRYVSDEDISLEELNYQNQIDLCHYVIFAIIIHTIIMCSKEVCGTFHLHVIIYQ